jgi:hypothetical protein
MRRLPAEVTLLRFLTRTEDAGAEAPVAGADRVRLGLYDFNRLENRWALLNEARSLLGNLRFFEPAGHSCGEPTAFGSRIGLKFAHD